MLQALEKAMEKTRVEQVVPLQLLGDDDRADTYTAVHRECHSRAAGWIF